MPQPTPTPTTEFDQAVTDLMKSIASQSPLNLLYGCMMIAMISIVVGASMCLLKHIIDNVIREPEQEAEQDTLEIRTVP
jgi:hypothetical protein